VAWIEEEAERFCGIDPAGTERLLPPAGFDPSMMLRLLTFAYACRVFESDDIVQRCHSEAIFGGMCEAEIPSAQQLRSFRRSHRALLEKILARVILRAVRDRFGLEAAMPYPELEADLRDRASERLNIARHMDQP
jgi:hypothetical protein